jgi:hypothetical protein
LYAFACSGRSSRPAFTCFPPDRDLSAEVNDVRAASGLAFRAAPDGETGFTSVVILTMARIGANAPSFSVLDAVLLRLCRTTIRSS